MATTSTTIPPATLMAAAQALATAMPASSLPIGPQLEAWALLVLGGSLKSPTIGVVPMPPGPHFYIRLNQHKAFKGPQSSWLAITHAGDDYELHNAVQILGISGAHHEVDVCLIAGTPDADAAPIPYSEFRAGLECKQHTAAISENVVRALVGTWIDFAHWPSYLWPPWGMVSTVPTLSANTHHLCSAYRIAFIGVDPANIGPTHPDIAMFAQHIEAHVL